MGRKIVSAKIDVVFKELFIRKRSLLKSFISDVLDIPFENIIEINLTNPEIPSNYSDGKLVRLDLVVRLKMHDGKENLINVELQVNSQKYFKQRTLFYWSKLYTSELDEGELYSQLKRTICINIIDFNITNKPDYHTEIIMSDKDTGEQFTDMMSIHFFELKKVKGTLDTNDRKTMWMHLIKADTEEELNMIKNTKIPEMEQAVQVIFDMNADNVLREHARQRQKAILDEASALHEAREEGIEIGREEGRKEGREEGIAIGETKGVNSVVEKMRKSGMSEEQIKAILGQ